MRDYSTTRCLGRMSSPSVERGRLTAVCKPQQKRRLAAAWAEGPTARLVRILADDIGAFLAAESLRPVHTNSITIISIMRGMENSLFNADGDPPIVLPAERTFTFMVTEEHSKLLRHGNAHWSGQDLECAPRQLAAPGVWHPCLSFRR
jgi:hypothetical protein